MVISSRKILFLTNIPSPYMVDFFNLFGEKIELTVVFERGQSAERNTNWRKYQFQNFHGFILKGLPISPDSAFSPFVITYLFQKFDFIFISNPTTPTGIFAIMILKLLKRKYVIFSEGAYPNNNRNFKEFIKRIALSNAWYYFSGNPSNDSYFLKYNKHARIIRFPFSSVLKKDIVTLKQKYRLKEAYRNQLGYTYYSKIAIMVGRFIKLKNFTSIIHSWIDMPKNYLLMVIGEGPEIKNYENIIHSKNLKNVKIVPFQSRDTLMKFYLLADILIHPTTYDVWGLILNEAFSKGLPVLTTQKCLAAEVMLIDNFNGKYISIDCNLSKTITDILSSESLIHKYSINSLKTIQNFTLEKMVETHIDFIKGKRHE
jgi:glycosyltransferase involved in cell wall biosynthesis